MISLAIIEGRDYTNYTNFKIVVDDYIKEIGTPSKIISGEAIGVDTMAEKYANEHNIPITVFTPDWNKFGKQVFYEIQILLKHQHVYLHFQLKKVLVPLIVSIKQKN